MKTFDWGNETAREREERYRRELEDLWQHAARIKAARSSRSGRTHSSAKPGRGGKGGASESEINE
jgi:hypothetical protein